MDRVALPGVSVVSDFDTQPLPFKDNSFDLVLAFHSIEHASDITDLMIEPEYYLPQSLEERREAARRVRMAEKLKIASEDWKWERTPSR